MLDLNKYSYDQLIAMEDLLMDLRGDRHIYGPVGVGADAIRTWLHHENDRVSALRFRIMDIMMTDIIRQVKESAKK